MNYTIRTCIHDGKETISIIRIDRTPATTKETVMAYLHFDNEKELSRKMKFAARLIDILDFRDDKTVESAMEFLRMACERYKAKEAAKAEALRKKEEERKAKEAEAQKAKEQLSDLLRRQIPTPGFVAVCPEELKSLFDKTEPIVKEIYLHGGMKPQKFSLDHDDEMMILNMANLIQERRKAKEALKLEAAKMAAARAARSGILEVVVF